MATLRTRVAKRGGRDKGVKNGADEERESSGSQECEGQGSRAPFRNPISEREKIMPLGVLNNISAVYAENNLNQTQSSLQNVLTQLSSGSKINSGADDPAGLSIANGLAANSAALSQSSSNASEGAGFLQVADGALSQVTSLLTSAVTLATEAGGGTLSSSQLGAANQEYQDILTQIGTIGSTTEYNGISVFSSDQTMSALTWGNAWTSATTTSTATAAAAVDTSITTGGSVLGTAPTVNQTHGTASAFSWTLSSTGSSGTLTSAAITSGAVLSGSLEFTAAGTGGGAIDQSLGSVTGGTLTLEAQSLQGLLNTNYGTGGDADFSVAASGGTLVISLGASASADQITGLGATSGTTDQAAPNGFTVTGITSGDWLNGSITLSSSGTGTVPSSISLAGVNQADLVSSVELSLGGTQSGGTITANPDYSVTYATGTLTVSLTNQAGTDNITGLTGTGSSVAQSAATSGTITFAANDQLGGGFSITPTKNGSAGQAVNINLAGVNTGSSSVTTSGSAVVAAVNQQLGSALAADYNVSYANNVLTIGVSTAGQAAGYDAVTLANGVTTGGGPGALSQGTVAQSNVATVNTAMGSFSLTPTGSTTTPITVSLAGLSPAGVGTANLLTGIQNQLNAGANAGFYTVSYDSTSDATSGNLTIGVTSAGVAAGVTGFTVAEASQAAASQETPIAGGVNIYTSDGTSTGSQNYNVTVGNLSDTSVGTSAGTSGMGTQVSVTVSGTTATGGTVAGAGAGTSLTGTNLSSQASAEAALQTVDNAINAVAYQRGQVGANINTLTAASNIASSQMTNITSAQNTITATDYASATSDMSKYEILTQTGISALAQANSTQQMVTKLLQ
jgi:flagellin